MKNFRNSHTNMKAMFLNAFITTIIIEFSCVGAGLLDGIIVTKMLGAIDMAATGIAYPFFSYVGVISGVLSIGMQNIIGANFARGKIKEAQDAFSIATITALISSALFTLIILRYSDQLAFLLGARDKAANLLNGTSDYLYGLSFGCIPLILNVVLACAVQMDSGSKKVQIGALVSSIADVVLDIVAVKLGLGLFGIGLASSISYFINFAILLSHFWGDDYSLKLHISHLPWKNLKQMTLLGSQKATYRLLNTIRPIILNAIIIYAGGSLGMAALAIHNNVLSFLEIPMTGISSAIALLTGIAYGEKNLEDVKEIGAIARKYTIVYSIIVGILICVFAKPIASFYVQDMDALKPLVTFALYCLACSLFCSTLVKNRISYLQAIHQIKQCQALTLLNRFVVVILCALIFVNLWGSYGVIISFVLKDIFICLGCLLFYVFKSYRNNKSFFPKEKDYLLLSHEFYPNPENIIELKVMNMEEASLTIEQLMLFCKGHKFDSRKTYRAVLCLEEVLINSIQYGMKFKTNANPIDVRVHITNGDIIIKIRDYFQKFDIKQRINLIKNNLEDFSNIGIKLVAKTAKEISYVNMLKTNNVIIRI